MNDLEEAIEELRKVVRRLQQGETEGGSQWVKVDSLVYALAFLESHVSDAQVRQFEAQVERANTAHFVNTQQIHKLEDASQRHFTDIVGLTFQVDELRVKVAPVESMEKKQEKIADLSRTNELRIIGLEERCCQLFTQVQNISKSEAEFEIKVLELEHKLEEAINEL